VKFWEVESHPKHPNAQIGTTAVPALYHRLLELVPEIHKREKEKAREFHGEEKCIFSHRESTSM
jgi:hypothetical protein